MGSFHLTERLVCLANLGYFPKLEHAVASLVLPALNMTLGQVHAYCATLASFLTEVVVNSAPLQHFRHLVVAPVAFLALVEQILMVPLQQLVVVVRLGNSLLLRERNVVIVQATSSVRLEVVCAIHVDPELAQQVQGALHAWLDFLATTGESVLSVHLEQSVKPEVHSVAAVRAEVKLSILSYLVKHSVRPAIPDLSRTTRRVAKSAQIIPTPLVEVSVSAFRVDPVIKRIQHFTLRVWNALLEHILMARSLAKAARQGQ